MKNYTGNPVSSRLINALAGIVIFDSIIADDVRGELWRVTLHDNRAIDFIALRTALRKEGFYFAGISDGALLVTANYRFAVNSEFRQDME